MNNLGRRTWLRNVTQPQSTASNVIMRLNKRDTILSIWTIRPDCPVNCCHDCLTMANMEMETLDHRCPIEIKV